MSEVARVVEYGGARPGKQVWTWCPGCDSLHPFTIEAPKGIAGERLNRGVTWTWNGSLDRPTFDPSLRVDHSVHLCEGEHDPAICRESDCDAAGHCVGAEVDGVLRWTFPSGIPEHAKRVYGHTVPHTREPAFGTCHSFLRDGRWQFLGDSAHALAGQTVDMVPLPERWRADDKTGAPQ